MGTGYIADFHLDVLSRSPEVEVIAVCDTVRGRAEAAASRYGVAHVTTDLEDLKGLGVEVAHLTVPPDLHSALARRLLESGVGVFVEKPLALSAGEVEQLGALATERDLPLAVNHNNVYHPAFARLMERVRAGEIGRVDHVRIALSVPLRQLDANDFTHWMFREPRNIVFEQATHPISQLVELVGSVEEVETHILETRELGPGQPFHGRWLVSGRGEQATVELYLSFGAAFTRSTLEVLGSDGSLEADLFHDQLSGERKTLWLDFWNSFLAGRGRARSLYRDARRNLFAWMGFTLGIAARKDAFYVGMRDSILGFYSALREGTRLPGDAGRALQVARWCDSIAAASAPAPAAAAPLPDPGSARQGEVAVTGATGFIGRRVVGRLLERGVPVTALVRRTHALPPEIEGPAREGLLRIVQVSLADGEALAAALEGTRAVIHLATGGGDTWEVVQRDMVEGSRRVGQAALDAGVSRFVYVSSVAALYGGPDAGAEELSDDWPTDPRPEARPIYARGKIAAEKTLLELHREKGLGLVLARPGVVLGEGTPMQHSGLGLWVRDNHCVGWGRGDHPLPLVWVDDVAEGLVRAALHEGDELHGRAMNLCARPPLTAAQVVEELRRHTRRRIAFHPRSMALSQVMEIGKWLVKKAGRRADAAFPSWRDLKARSLARPFRCETARQVLGWEPVEDREAFLDAAVRVYAPTVQREP